MEHDDLMPRERAAAEKKKPAPTPPAPRQPLAPVAVVECAKCHIRHAANESCPGCGRRILNG
jgi:hypothetical protein